MNRKHHELRAWQVAMSLVKDSYQITASFLKEEIYVLTNQMRRTAVSIPSNIEQIFVLIDDLIKSLKGRIPA